MTKTNINVESRVRAVLMKKLGADEREVTLDASLTHDLGADSLDVAETIMELEKEFEDVDLKIEDSEAENLNTVEQIIGFIQNYAAKTA